MEEPIYIKNMRALRIEAHYTQKEVSRKLNIQRQTYSNYENELRMPPMDIIISLADLYHVSVDYLIRGIESDPGAQDPVSEQEQRLLEDFSGLTDRSREEVLQFILFKKMFPS